MSHRLAKCGFVVALITGATALAVAPVHAEMSVTVAPALMTLDGEAGSGGSISIAITNGGDEAFALDAAVAVFQDMDGERSAVDWAVVRPGRLRLAPGESGSATVHITIPDEVASGGRYAAITFTTAQARADAETAAIAGRVTVPILLAVRGSGPLKREPILERFAPFIEPDGRLGFRAGMRNDGNVHTAIAGSVRVGEPGDEKIAGLDILERILLPDASRVLDTHGTIPLLTGERLEAMATFGPPPDDEPTAFEPIATVIDFDPRPRLEMGAAGVCENLDRGPGVHVTLDNRGDVGLVPSVRFEVLDAGGALVASATADQPLLAWPGEALTVVSEADQRLVSGTYDLRATATFGSGSTLETATTFSIGGDPSIAAPICAAAVYEGPPSQDGT